MEINKNTRLYVSDLDGTLMNDQKMISDYTKVKINELTNKGVNFTIATARTAASTLKILKGTDIKMPIILMNGALIYDIKNEKYIKAEIIKKASVNNVLQVLRICNTTGFMYSISEEGFMTYYENLDNEYRKEFYEERVNKYYKTFKQASFEEIASLNDIIYFTLIDVYDNLKLIYDRLKDDNSIDVTFYKDIYEQDLWYLEIYSRNASKYNAIRYLREKYSFEKIIGFGDNLNDIPLFKACDETYAVSNAFLQLKELASGIISENNSDSVVKHIINLENRG